NRQLTGVNAEIWVHTCWGNPNQQRVHWKVPSYERALPHLLRLNCDVLTLECASSDGQDLHLFKHINTDKKIGIGVVNHCNTVVEPAEHVAALIRKGLEFIPKERLVISSDCGFGREGLSRRIAFYKCVALVEGTNIVRGELGLPQAHVRAADPKLWFAGQEPGRWPEWLGSRSVPALRRWRPWLAAHRVSPARPRRGSNAWDTDAVLPRHRSR